MVAAFGIDHVAAIGELRPDAVGEEFVVRLVGKAVLARAVVGALHFLHEHHVGAHLAHGLAQLRKNELAVEGGESLVDVDRHDGQGRRDRHWSGHAWSVSLHRSMVVLPGSRARL